MLTSELSNSGEHNLLGMTEATEDGKCRAKIREESSHILDMVAGQQKQINCSSQ